MPSRDFNRDDPQTGRFLTQDPIGLAGGVNLYAYAGNNPVAFADPFGLCPPKDSSTCTGQDLINQVAGSAEPLGRVVNRVGEFFGVNSLGEAADRISNGQVWSGLFLLGMTIAENSPEGEGAKIIFSGKKVTSALAEALGIARHDLGKRIETIKRAARLGGADNVNIDDVGNVISKKSKEIIGNVYDEYKQK